MAKTLTIRPKTPDLIDKLKEQAKKEQRTVNNLILKILSDYINSK